MTWGDVTTFPRAILHIDGDSFFAACEVAKNPQLKGKPVITGKERGIVSACTYEAKALGIKRGMKLYEVRKICPEAIILPSDYETYSLFSHRMYEIVRRYTPTVEEYSIDECFADITGLRSRLHMSYEKIAESIQRDLNTELGMTFSIGLSCTKSLAKLGSKWKKPHGLTCMAFRDIDTYLAKIPIGQVWGIGVQTTAYLQKYGISTTLDFKNKERTWVERMLAKPAQEIWQELNGVLVNDVDNHGRETYHSISKTKTFTPPSKNPAFIFSQLSKNVENACIKARRWNLRAKTALVFLKTQDFRFHSFEVVLPMPSNNPQDILSIINNNASTLYKKGVLYRASGITLVGLEKADAVQLDMFGASVQSEKFVKAFASVDALSEKYGKHAVFLGSSFEAMKFGAHLGTRGDETARVTNLFKGETKRRRLGIPSLGEVN